MYIQQIEIDNFKSFANKTVIPFERGFTTVSGPNGSGKSNIIDSILFCLGLSSSRTMRAEKLTDLINNLSRRREASVTILFGENDDSKDEKIIVSRKIKDSGQSGYASTYYLNGKVATLTEIHDRLSQHNISPGAYNVLMQGDVTGIINMSATERRKIIDEIAGVAEFDRKIEQAQKELESVSGSIERFTLLLTELQSRVEQLAQEREQALKYQKLKDEKQKFEDMLLTAKFLDLKRAYEVAEQNIVQARKQKTKSNEQIAVIEKQLAQTREQLAEIANEVKRKGEDQQIALKKQIEGLKGAISRKKDSLQFSSQKRQENLRNVERAQEEIERLNAKIEDVNVTVEGFEHQKAEVEARLKKEQKALEALEAKVNELLSNSGELGSQRNELKDALTQAEDILAGYHRQKLDIEADIERKTRDKTYQEERLSQSSGRYGELTKEQTVLEKAMSEADMERKAFENQLNDQQLVVSKSRVALNTLTSEVNQLHREFSQLDAQKRAYEEINFGRSVDTVLNQGIPGVHGTLAQLGSTEDEFATALEIALGARMKSIVVDNDAVAEEGIELLKRARAGRATFLPLNKMRGPGSLSLLPDDEGIIDYAVNLMQFDGRYENVFAYALGDTVIVEDMAVARKYLRKFRMVTLDGSLMEKTGAMTGGSAPSAQAGGKLASGKLDQQLSTMRDTLEKKDSERNALEKKVSQAELKLDTLKEDYGKYLGELQRKELQLQAIKRELAQINSAQGDPEVLKALTKEIATLEKTLKEAITNIDAETTQIDTLKATLEEIDAQLPTQQLESLKVEIEAVQFQIRTYETQIRNVDGDIQQKRLEKEFQEKGIQSYHEQITQLKANNETIDKEKVSLLEEIELIEVQISALEAQTGELDEELQRLQAERDTIQAKLIQEEQQKYNLNHELTLIEEQISSYQARKKELMPLIEAAKDELIEAGLDPETITQQELPAEDEVIKNIQKVQRQMDAMGAVNMRAIQEYDEVMGRNQELTEKINTLSHEREDLGIKINGYAELKFNAFMTAFDNVNRNFQEIFGELSDGEGQLILTNPTSPFEGGLTIEARPRGKKMQRMESMSGGEKSLTALAFVFSFQRYMPAPFYAFDEVDMFLDGINAEKLSHMVKKQSGNAQFIVVSLRKPMLEHSDRTVGVTQKRDGISKVTGVMLQHAS